MQQHDTALLGNVHVDGDFPVAVSVTTNRALRRSYDRKVTQLIRRQKSKDNVVIGNSFGLPAGLSCPGRTEFCRRCYAESLEKHKSAVGNLVARNWQVLQECGDDVEAIVTLLDAMIADFYEEWVKAAKTGRVTLEDLIFRIHWDGDFYSKAYAQAWVIVMRRFPAIRFWTYTRTFDVVPILAPVKNLTLYLSIDRYNAEAAKPYLRYKRVHAAWCDDTQELAESVKVSISPRRVSVACPENVKRIPLVIAQSGRRMEEVPVGADAQGACSACRLCVDGVKDVSFAVKKK